MNKNLLLQSSATRWSQNAISYSLFVISWTFAQVFNNSEPQLQTYLKNKKTERKED